MSIPLSEKMHGRANNIDFLRFVLATLVLVFHCFPLLPAQAHGRGGLAETLADRGGSIAVPFFFVLSGFLVTQSFERSRTTGAYFLKRVSRIFPAFVVASFFCAFVAGPLGTDNAAVYWHHFRAAKFLAYLFLLPADVVGPDMTLVFPHQAYPGLIDGSFWTLRYEFVCYVLVAVLGVAGLLRRRGGVAAAFTLLAITYAAQEVTALALFPRHEYPFLGSPARWAALLLFFLSGMTLYLYREQVPYSPILFRVSLLGMVASAFSAVWFAALLPLWGGYVLMYAAFSRRLPLLYFARHGDFSYGIYLYAFPVQQLLVYYLGPLLTPGRLFWMAFPLTLALAFLSWHGIEKPCLRWKQERSALPGTMSA